MALNKEIKAHKIAIQAESKIYPNCKSRTVAPFPQGVVTDAYYGDNLKAYVAYLNTYYMLSYKRICEYFADMCQHPISECTIFNILKRYYDKLETTEEKTKLLQNHYLSLSSNNF